MNPELDRLMDGLLTAIGSGDYGQETDALRAYLADREAKLLALAREWEQRYYKYDLRSVQATEHARELREALK